MILVGAVCVWCVACLAMATLVMANAFRDGTYVGVAYAVCILAGLMGATIVLLGRLTSG